MRRRGQAADRAAIPRASLWRLVRMILRVLGWVRVDAHGTAPGGSGGGIGTSSKSMISPPSVSVSATYALS